MVPAVHIYCNSIYIRIYYVYYVYYVYYIIVHIVYSQSVTVNRVL